MANNTGVFFNINDNDGIPLIGVSTDGRVFLDPFYGNVGVGITNPTSKLHVVGDVEVTGLNVSGISTLGITSTTNLTSQQLNVSGISTLGITSTTNLTSQQLNVSGSVGIGTTNPTSKLTVNGNTTLETLNVSGITTFQNNVNFGDNDKIFLGDSGDLEIYHNGANSFIVDQGNGDLIIRGSSVFLQDSAGDSYIEAYEDGSAYLLFDGSISLQTIGAGVTITGTTFTNELSVSGVSTFNANVGIGTTNPTSTLHIIGDARVGIDTSQGVILTSANGTKYRLIVSDAGALSTILVP